jgi:homoserine kinase type II
VITQPGLALCLKQHWGLADARIGVHNDGMGSATWFVDHGDDRWVAKAVAQQAASQFAGGLTVAQRRSQRVLRPASPHRPY